MFARIRQEVNHDQLSTFKENIQKLFLIIARELDSPEATKFRDKILSKITRRGERKSLFNFESNSTVQLLVNHFDRFVWTDVWENMGRPSSTIDDYIKESKAKIAEWSLIL